MYMISPEVLKRYGILVHKCIQEQNEIMVTFPQAFHSGYNIGYNVAESINFALPRWLDIGARATVCRCVEDSVYIDVAKIFNHIA